MNLIYDNFDLIGDKRVPDEVLVKEALKERPAPVVTPIEPKQQQVVAPTPQPVVEQRPKPQLDPSVNALAEATGVQFEPYYDYDREKSLKSKQKAALIADALRVIGQGVAGSKGMKIDKDPQDPTMARTQAELDRMQALYDQDVRRTRDMNLQRQIRQEDLVYANDRQDERYEKSNEDWFNRYNMQRTDKVSDDKKAQENRLEQIEASKKSGNDLEYQKELLKLKAEYEKEVAGVTTDRDKQKVANHYEEMFNYKQRLHDAGLDGSNASLNKPFMNVTDPSGKTIQITQDQASKEAYNAIEEARKLRKSNFSEYMKLPQYIQDIVQKDKTLSTAEVKRIMSDFYGGQSEETTQETDLFGDPIEEEEDLWK